MGMMAAIKKGCPQCPCHTNPGWAHNSCDNCYVFHPQEEWPEWKKPKPYAQKHQPSTVHFCPMCQYKAEAANPYLSVVILDAHLAYQHTEPDGFWVRAKLANDVCWGQQT